MLGWAADLAKRDCGKLRNPRLLFLGDQKRNILLFGKLLAQGSHKEAWFLLWVLSNNQRPYASCLPKTGWCFVSAWFLLQWHSLSATFVLQKRPVNNSFWWWHHKNLWNLSPNQLHVWGSSHGIVGEWHFSVFLPWVLGKVQLHPNHSDLIAFLQQRMSERLSSTFWTTNRRASIWPAHVWASSIQLSKVDNHLGYLHCLGWPIRHLLCKPVSNHLLEHCWGSEDTPFSLSFHGYSYYRVLHEILTPYLELPASMKIKRLDLGALHWRPMQVGQHMSSKGICPEAACLRHLEAWSAHIPKHRCMSLGLSLFHRFLDIGVFLCLCSEW